MMCVLPHALEWWPGLGFVGTRNARDDYDQARNIRAEGPIPTKVRCCAFNPADAPSTLRTPLQPAEVMSHDYLSKVIPRLSIMSLCAWGIHINDVT